MIEQITIFFQIVLINLVLAGDNAIIIGLLAILAVAVELIYTDIIIFI